MKKKLVLALATVFAFSGCFSACGSKPAEDAAPERSAALETVEEEVAEEEIIFDNAADLLDLYYEQKSDNYHSVYECALDMGATVANDSMTMKLVMSLDMDLSGDNMHGNMVMDSESMGQKSSDKIELYVEKDGDDVICYEYNADYDVWRKEVNGFSEMAFAGTTDKLIDEDKIKDAAFSYNEDTEEYELTMKVPDSSAYGFTGSYLDEDSLEMMLGDEADIYGEMMDLMKDLEMHYFFDKDAHLIRLDIDELKYEKEYTEDDVTGTISMSLSTHAELSGFGEIKEEDCVVPAEIREKAEGFDGEDDYDTDLFGDDEYTTELSEDDLAAVGEPDTSLPDFYGAINGITLKPGEKNDYAETFKAAGFKLDKENDGTFGSAWLEYPSDDFVDGTLYAKDFPSSCDDINKEIKENGFYGYSVDVPFAEKKPDMTFGGLTWGASKKDILRVYGKPSNYTSFESSNFEMLGYGFDDNYIEFTVYMEGWYEDLPGGLMGVKVIFYS